MTVSSWLLGSRLGRLCAGMVLAAPFFVLSLKHYVHLELWCDELATLMWFASSTLFHAAFDYPAANNHILFSLLVTAYTKACALDVGTVMRHPETLRLALLALSGVAAWLLYLAGRQAAGYLAGLAAVPLLLYCVPYYNIATQIRGYQLSALLICLHLYLTLRASRRLTPAPGIWFAQAVTGALVIYTIPSNVYYLLAMAVVVFLHELTRSEPSPGYVTFWRNLARRFPGSLAQIASLGLAWALYVPVLDRLLANSQVAKTKPFNLSILTSMLPEVLTAFSHNVVLLVIVAIGLGLFAAIRERGAKRLVIGLSLLLLLPFVLSCLRGDILGFDRIFVPLVPVFALLLAVCLAKGCQAIVKAPRTRTAALAGIGLFCVMALASYAREQKAAIAAANAQGVWQQSILFNTFQSEYHLLPLVDAIREEFTGRNVVSFPQGDMTPLIYFEFFGINALDISQVDGGAETLAESVFVSSHPERDTAVLRARGLCAPVVVIPAGINYNHLIVPMR